MPDESAPADGHKRAAWIGLRTLRQRPKLVGQGKDGQPIYEIRSVRLMLRDNAAHFTRLAQCSKCDREVPGARVLTPADLSRPSHAVICEDCVRTAPVAAGHSRQRPPVHDAESSPVSEVAENADLVSEPAVQAPDDGRTTALESQLVAVTGMLTDLAEAHRSESIHRNQATEAMQSEMSAALARSVDEAHANQSLAEAVLLVRSELDGLASGLAETRSELQRVADSHAKLAALQTDLDQRLAEVRAWISAQPTSALQMEVFRGEIGQAESRLAGSLVAQRDELYDALTEGLASLEQRLRGSEAARAQLTDAQGPEGTPAAPVPAPVRPDLLADLDRQLQDAETRLAGRLSRRDR